MFETDSSLSRPEEVSSTYRIHSYNISCYTVSGTFSSKMHFTLWCRKELVLSFSAVTAVALTFLRL